MRVMIVCFVWAFGSAWWSRGLPGDVDPGFDPGAGFDGEVHVVVPRDDGGAWVGGSFRNVAGTPRNALARLNADGSLDAFDAGIEGSVSVETIVDLGNGKILIGGNFTSVGGVGINRIARLNADASVDTTFNPGVGPNSTVETIYLCQDGKLLIGGRFNRFNGIDRSYIARLNADGSLDSSFRPGLGPNGWVYDVIESPDGKVLICGAFTTVGGVVRNYIARLNADGSLDPTFDPGDGANSAIVDMVLLGDGRLLIGGNFTQFNDASRRYLAMLTSDGLADVQLNADLNNSVQSVLALPGGSILIGGNFTTINGINRNRIARLLGNGEVDVSFNPGGGANNTVQSLAMDRDGDVFAGGNFTTVNGVSRPGLAKLAGTFDAAISVMEFSMSNASVEEPAGSISVDVIRGGNLDQSASVVVKTVQGTANPADFSSLNETLNFAVGETTKTVIVTINDDSELEGSERFGLALSNPSSGAALGARQSLAVEILDDERTNLAGGVDLDFIDGGGANDDVYAILVQPDGKILVGGRFTFLPGENRNRIGRLNPDGSVDPEFHSGAYVNSDLYAIARQNDGGVLIGGNFTQVNGRTRNRLARLREDGTLDETFNAGLGFNGQVHALAVQSDQKILVGGTFTTFNGSTVYRLIRLNADGSRDFGFDTGSGFNSTVESIAVQADGGILVGGSFSNYNGKFSSGIARLNPDGLLDPTFNPGEGANSAIQDITIQPDGKILIVGSFSFYNSLSRRYVARLLPNGLADPGFQVDLNGAAMSLALASDGKILVGGGFTRVNDVNAQRIIRLLPNGEFDASFSTGGGADNTVNAVAIDANGDILLGGVFTTINGLPQPHLSRLKGTSSNPGGQMEFAQSVYPVSESQGTLAIQVLRRGDASIEAAVDFSTANGTADGGDFTPQSGTLIFAVGETSKTISIAITDDEALEGLEEFKIQLSNPTNGALLGGQRMASIQIEASDPIQQAGRVDLSFNVAGGANGEVNALTMQADDKVLVVGNFSVASGANSSHVARLNPDGTPDESWNPSAYANNQIYTSVIQADGKILIGGNFTQVNGSERIRIARLNPDGALDKNFLAGQGINGPVYSLLVQQDHKIVVGGAFTTFQGNLINRIVRLNPDGSIDLGFNFWPGADNTIFKLVQQPDGKLLVGGQFTRIQGVLRNRLARLNLDGTLDSTFDIGSGANSTIGEILLQPDGRILVGGSFSVFNGATRRYLARLTRSGLLDASFEVDFNGAVNGLALTDSGRILAAGNFSRVNGLTLNRLVRLLPDGRVDESFAPGAGADQNLNDVQLDENGDVLIAGDFNTFDGVNVGHLIRLHGSSDPPGGEIEFVDSDLQLTEDAGVVDIPLRRNGNTGSEVAVEYEISSELSSTILENGSLTFASGEGSGAIQLNVAELHTAGVDETLTIRLLNPTNGALLGGNRVLRATILKNVDGGSAGALDPDFFALGGAGDAVLDIRIQPDGKILAGGDFTLLQGENRNHLGRLNANGATDPAFYPSFNADRTIRAVAVQTDGKILVGGDFREINQTPLERIARLNPDGTLDETFNSGFGADGAVNAIEIQSDGKILIGGAFTLYDGWVVNRLARLNPDGSRDTTFATGEGINGTLWSLVRQPDGRIVIGGEFTLVNGIPRNRVARLMPNGAVDPDFNPGLGPNNTVVDMALQSDGKLVIGGWFSEINGVRSRYLARLMPNGTVDPGFIVDANGNVESVAVDSRGRIIAGGRFTRFNAEVRNRVVRVLPDGQLDPSFEMPPDLNDSVFAVAVDGNDDILLGGNFTSVNGSKRNRIVRLNGSGFSPAGELEFASGAFFVAEGQGFADLEIVRYGDASSAASITCETIPGSADETDYQPASSVVTFGAGERSQVLSVPITDDRLMEGIERFQVELTQPSAGALLGSRRTASVSIEDNDQELLSGKMELGFGASGGADGEIQQAVLQDDGKLVVGGDFSAIDGANRNRIARLNFDGTPDPAFFPSASVNGLIRALALQPDGKILIGGDFTLVNGVSRNRLARLNADGTLDEDFNIGDGFNSSVFCLSLLPDGRMMVGGTFSNFNGEAVSTLVRLNADGSFDPGFHTERGPNATVWSLARQPDGRILIGGDFTQVGGIARNRLARLNDDGTLDFTFDPGSGANSTVLDMALQRDGKIVIGGWFSQFNGLSQRYIARLLPNGLIDADFQGTANSIVESVAVDEDERILAGGWFTAVNGEAQNRIARLLPNGLLDPSFATGLGADDIVFDTAIDDQNNVLIGGRFTTFDGIEAPRLARVFGSSDVSGGEIEFQSAEYETGESDGTLMIEVVRHGNLDAQSQVTFEAREGSATKFDFTLQNLAVTFNPGQSSRSLAVSIIDDELAEVTEDFEIAITAMTSGAVAGSRAKAWIQILDDDFDAAAGTLNTVFASAGASNGGVNSLALQEDGKVVVGGDFSVLAGENRNRIARIDPNGTIDPGFNPGAYANGTIQTIALEPDGRILVGGNFSEINGEPRGRLARLEPDGTLDMSFNPAQGFNGQVNVLLVTAGDKILAGGSFTSFDGSVVNRLIRFELDGLVDVSFDIGTGFNNTVWSLAEQADGKILAGGDFTSVDGIVMNRLTRLNADGTLDEGFDTGNGANSTVFTLAIQPDEKILLGGWFSRFNEESRFYLARLWPDGTIDDTFVGSPNSNVNSIALGEDERIVIGGWFTRFNNEDQNRVARLLPNGQRDTSFIIGTGPDNIVNTVAVGPDDDVLIGGTFTLVDGFPAFNLAKLNGGGDQPVPVQIMTQPGDQFVEPGQDVTFSVEVFGSEPIVYQWRRNGVNLNIPGSNERMLILPNVQPEDAGKYSVIVANEARTVISAPGVLTLNLPVWPFADGFADRGIIVGPNASGLGSNEGASEQSLEPIHAGNRGGSSMWLKWTAPATGILTLNTTGSSFDTLLAVYEGNSIGDLTLLAADDDGGGFFTSRLLANVISGREYSLVVDGFGGATGDIILNMAFEESDLILPVIQEQPSHQLVVPGETAVFEVVAEGTSLSYQWFLDDAIIPGATDSSWIIPNAQASDVGVYKVTVTNGVGLSVTSLPAALEIASVPGARSATKFQDVFNEENQSQGLSAAEASNHFRQTGFVSVAAGSIGTQIFDNFGATTEADEPNHAGVIGGASKWYGIEAASDGILDLSTEGSEVPTVIAVYTGTTLLTLQLVAEDNSVADLGYSHVSFEAVKGTQYLVAIDTIGGIFGNIQLHWSLEAVQEPSEITLGVPEITSGNHIRFPITGPKGRTVSIEASHNLNNDWVEIHTHVLSGDPVEFDDPDAVSETGRFYRAVLK